MVESAHSLFREQFDLDVSHGRVQSYQGANLGACHSRLQGHTRQFTQQQLLYGVEQALT